MKRVASSVEAVGGNAESASNTVVNSDTAANALLSRHGQRADGESMSLRRPIEP